MATRLNKQQLEEIYKNIPFELSEEKKNEIAELEFESLARIRNNLTYKTFNRLFVIGRAPSIIQPNGNPITLWWCICSCENHNIIKVRVNNLSSNNTKSCGCLDIEKSTARIVAAGHKCKKDLTNQQFGNILALEDSGERKYGSPVWKCKCLLCGNENYYITANTLVHHTPKSCGCESRSKGAIVIEKILDENNIFYTKEKTFDTCRFPDTNNPARFDYYVDNSYLIEYDGEQHFEEKDPNYFRDTLEKRQEHDNYKNNWCKENNIKLIRIPCYELSKINQLKDFERYIVC